MIVTLRYYDDLSSKQIAELVELSPAAVDARLSRARQEMKKYLGMGSKVPAECGDAKG